MLLKLFLTLLIFSIAIYVRISWFDEHFTHYDDIKVDQLSNYKVDVFAIECANKWGEQVWDSPIYQNVHKLISKPYNSIRYATGFSHYWTYAPAQFVMTFSLLPFSYNYESVKFWGRLPSLLFGLSAIFMSYYIGKNYTKSTYVSLFAVAVLGMSWQSILYCMHMSNYENIIFLGFLSTYFLYKVLLADKLNYWMICSFIFGIMTWFHYQVVCYFGGFMLAFLLKKLQSGPNKKHIFIEVILNCVCYAIAVLPLLSFANLDSNPTWNTGVNGQFLFHKSLNAIYLMKFWVGNFFLVFRALLSPVPLDTILSYIITIMYLILFIVGLFQGIREKRNSPNFYLASFCIGVLLCECFFVLIGAFTLSPTRHNNLLIPIFVIGILLGVYYFSINEKLNINSMKILGCGGIIIFFSFFHHYQEIKNERTDLFNHNLINGLIYEFQPDLVIDRSAPQIWYLLDKQYARREIVDYQTDFFDLDDNSDNNKTILLISHTTSVNDYIKNELCEYLKEKDYLSTELSDKFSKIEPTHIYERHGTLDFDFYNVTNGAANNLFYYVYQLE